MGERAAKNSAKSPSVEDNQPQWTWQMQIVVSLAIVLHLSAVVAAPWSRPEPASELSRTVSKWFRPYINATFLNQGYRFFAPDPPPASNIVRYQVTRKDGTVTTGEFPDRNVHWPRLVYHRHFMLTSQVITDAVPPEEQIVPAQLPPEVRASITEHEMANYRAARQAFVTRLNGSAPAVESIARHLLNEYDGARVKLLLVQHRVPARIDVKNGLDLSDESLFYLREIGELVAGEPWQWSEAIRGFGKPIL